MKNKHTSLIEQAIHAVQILPGIGPKSAQRIVYHLLQHERNRGAQLCEVLHNALQKTKHCGRCRNFTEEDVCTICQDSSRDNTRLCVVESPSDVMAIEQTHAYKGYYFVLMGRLSPLDGIGPEKIGIPLLLKNIQTYGVSELILATNPTVEGEATAYYISEQCQTLSVVCTRLAAGIPMGGELEYLDGRTIEQAILARSQLATEETQL